MGRRGPPPSDEQKVFIVWSENRRYGVVFAGEDAEGNAHLALKGKPFDSPWTLALDFEQATRGDERIMQVTRLLKPNPPTRRPTNTPTSRVASSPPPPVDPDLGCTLPNNGKGGDGG